MLDDETAKRVREIGSIVPPAFAKLDLASGLRFPQLDAFVLQQKNLGARLAEAYGPILEQLNELIPLLQRAGEAWARLPEGTRLAQDIAASRGWYLGVWNQSLAEMSEVVALAERGDADALEEWIEAQTRSDVDTIRRGVKTNFPERSSILDQAFQAHERGHYAVSIPTMLAQADGIHFDLVEQHLFRRNNRARLKKRLGEMLGDEAARGAASLTVLFLRPLLKENALGETTQARDRRKEADPKSDPLNRHGVLHGTDTDYATERHSLRAVALLNFLAEVRRDLEHKSAWSSE